MAQHLHDATVKVVESLGRETLFYADAGSLTTTDSESQQGYIAVHRGSQTAFAYGAPVKLAVDPRDIFVFAKESGIPLYAVNTPREMVSAVRKKGFELAPHEQLDATQQNRRHAWARR